MDHTQKRHLEEVLGKTDWQPATDVRRIGYARVSTDDQNLDMQLDALRKAGVLAGDIFSEKTSATSVKRPELKAALDQCRRGDVFICWRLDRVARSLRQLLDIMEDLSARGVGFVSLSENVDTTTAIGRLYVHIAGAFAEFERQLIQERTRAGVARAKERGVRFGAQTQIDLKLAEELLRDGLSATDVARELGVSRQTVYNHFSPQRRQKLARLGPKKPKA